MIENRPLVRFALLFLVTYLGLLLLNELAPIKKVHHEFFASVGEWVYNGWHPEIRAIIDTDVEAKGANTASDYVLTAFNKRKYKAVQIHNTLHPMERKEFSSMAMMAFNARMSHVIGSFFLISLIVATPNSWRRKLIGILLVLYLYYIIVSMKLTFILEMEDGSRTQSDGLWYSLSGILGNNQTYQELMYILILFMWILVSISKTSINALTASLKAS